MASSQHQPVSQGSSPSEDVSERFSTEKVRRKRICCTSVTSLAGVIALVPGILLLWQSERVEVESNGSRVRNDQTLIYPGMVLTIVGSILLFAGLFALILVCLRKEQIIPGFGRARRSAASSAPYASVGQQTATNEGHTNSSSSDGSLPVAAFYDIETHNNRNQDSQQERPSVTVGVVVESEPLNPYANPYGGNHHELGYAPNSRPLSCRDGDEPVVFYS